LSIRQFGVSQSAAVINQSVDLHHSSICQEALLRSF
jgi:hypothetical protein